MQVQQIRGRDSLHIQSPEIKFSANINDIFANDLHLTNVHATAPVINIRKWDTNVISDTSEQQQTIRIDKFTSTEPDIYISTYSNDSLSIVNIPFSENSFANATGITLSGNAIQLETLMVNTTAATYTKRTGEKLGIEKGKIELEMSDVNFGKKDGKKNWSAFIDKFSVHDTGGLKMGNRSNLHFNQASLGNLKLSSDYMPSVGQFLKANVSAWLRIPVGEYSDSNTTFKWYNAAYNYTNRSLSLDSLNYHPTSPLDSVLAVAPYQLDYITVKTGAVTINGLDAEKYEKDSSFIADVITIINPVMTIYRDKSPPSSPNKKEKALPVGMIKNISLPVEVKSVQIEDGMITYGEKNGKSRKEGTLFLTRINGRLENLKNHNLTDDDSLSLTLNGYMMDSAYLNICLKESYTDSLSGFLITAQIKPTPLSILNPVLVPLSNVKLTSGQLDSLTLHAIGRNDIALGEMDMHYHNLRIQLVNDGDPDKSTFLQKVMTFVANTFVIKRNNTSRTGVIYYSRQSTQSFVNYIVKMTQSGMASSVGLKKNRKYMKQYKKELEESGLPAPVRTWSLSEILCL
jgi:3D (Asp-Asp-Asp) domain-containing protein